jgi:DNA polymerase III subunit alpha
MKIMDISEFEIRYNAYVWLNKIVKLGLTQEQILSLVPITDGGVLTQELTKTEPSQLWELTRDTYTSAKTDFVTQYGSQQFGNYTVADYVHRLEYELKVVKEMWFNTYLLVVSDFITWAKDNHIPVGPGRGSAAWSLLTYCISITDVNPLEFWLLFERFLNPARVSLPDIDVDFDDERRSDVLNYVRNKYGQANVVNIGTFMSMSDKAAFKDVARVMGIPFDRSNQISKLFTEVNDKGVVDISASFEKNDELAMMLDADPKIKKTLEITLKLIWNIRQTWVHACGVVIGPGTVIDYVPVQLPPNESDHDKWYTVTQFEGKFVEEAGLIKMDFLWLSNLTIIRHAIKIIIARHKQQWQPLPEIFQEYQDTTEFHPPIEDTKTFEMIFQRGDTSGVFQFESDGMRRFLVPLKPDRIEDILAMNALYRPGPMEFIPSFIKRKNGEEDIRYMGNDLHELLTKKYSKQVADEQEAKMTEDLQGILWVTYGIAVYQEQLMQLVQSMAWFSLAEADELRRGVGKKIKEVIMKVKAQFIDRAQEYHDYKPETATWTFEKMIEPAAMYSFNKSHAAAYALIAFQTAYLKAHYPIEFGAALLRSAETNTDELSKFINEMKLNGMIIQAPSINESYNHVAAIDHTIKLGFLSIKGVGDMIGEFIEQERQKSWVFTSLTDFLTRCATVVNRKSLEGLIKAWALDNFANTNTLLQNLELILEWTKSSQAMPSDGGLFGWWFVQNSLTLRTYPEMSRIDRIKTEHSVFNAFVSQHPFDWLYPWIKSRNITLLSQITKENSGDFNLLCFVVHITRARKKWYFIKVEDITGQVEFFVKEVFDIKPFDIMIIEWYKGRSARMSKMIKTTLDDIIEQATRGNKYDASETVAYVKSKRLWITTTNEKSSLNTDVEVDSETGETIVLDTGWLDQKIADDMEELLIEEELIDDETTNDLVIASEDSSSINSDSVATHWEEENWDNASERNNKGSNIEVDRHVVVPPSRDDDKVVQPELPPNHFPMPSDMSTVKKAMWLMKTHPWEIIASLWGMKITLSDDGLEELKRIL